MLNPQATPISAKCNNLPFSFVILFSLLDTFFFFALVEYVLPLLKSSYFALPLYSVKINANEMPYFCGGCTYSYFKIIAECGFGLMAFHLSLTLNCRFYLITFSFFMFCLSREWICTLYILLIFLISSYEKM